MFYERAFLYIIIILSPIASLVTSSGSRNGKEPAPSNIEERTSTDSERGATGMGRRPSVSTGSLQMPSQQVISRNIIPPSAAGRQAAMPSLSIHHIPSTEIQSIMRGVDADDELMDDAISQMPVSQYGLDPSLPSGRNGGYSKPSSSRSLTQWAGTSPSEQISDTRNPGRQQQFWDFQNPSSGQDFAELALASAMPQQQQSIAKKLSNLPHLHKRWTAADYRNASSMRDRGIKYKDILSKTGMPRSTLSKYIKDSKKANHSPLGVPSMAHRSAEGSAQKLQPSRVPLAQETPFMSQIGAPSNYQLAPLPQSLPSRHLQSSGQPAEHATSVDPFGHLDLVGAPSNYQLAPLPQSLPSRHLQTSGQPAEHTTSVDPFGHLDLGETINYAQQAINWRERLETERDHLIHSSTRMGEYSSRLQQLGNLEQQINQSNMLVQSLGARAELLSNRTAGPSYRQNIASTYAYGQSSQHNAGHMAQQFPYGQNTQTMPSVQVDPSQLYNLPGDASFSALLAPYSSIPAIHPNMPSTSYFHHATRTSSGQLAPSNVVAVPAFPSNMPSSSAVHRPTQPSVSQMLRTAQANMGGQGATHYTQPASGSGVYRGDPSSHRGVQHHYSNQPFPRETSYGARQFQQPSSQLSSANYNTAAAAPPSSRNNQTQSHATSGRVNPGPSAAAPSRASSSEGENM